MERISSGTQWEREVGYSRAVRVGSEIHVAGTTATDEDGTVVGHGNPYRQTVEILHTVAEALGEAGATLDDVVRTRIFVTDIDDWEEVGRAHGEVFGTIRPATTMVQVERLIDPAMLVEIEVDARVEG